jgi:hypothetical protein
MILSVKVIAYATKNAPTDYRNKRGVVRRRYRDLKLITYEQVLYQGAVAPGSSLGWAPFGPEGVLNGVTRFEIAAGPADVVLCLEPCCDGAATREVDE